VRSRFLIGAGAWLLGAIAASAGSLYAVDQLGQDLLVQQGNQVSVAMVNSELALENSEHRTQLPGQSPSVTPSATRSTKPRGRPSPTTTPTSNPGQLLTSSDGTAVATCQQGQAYLVYVSPYNGYEADHVVRGPARVASVVFRGQSSGIVMDVSCRGGQPHARLSQLQGDDGSGYDD